VRPGDFPLGLGDCAGVPNPSENASQTWCTLAGCQRLGITPRLGVPRTWLGSSQHTGQQQLGVRESHDPSPIHWCDQVRCLGDQQSHAAFGEQELDSHDHADQYRQVLEMQPRPGAETRCVAVPNDQIARRSGSGGDLPKLDAMHFGVSTTAWAGQRAAGRTTPDCGPAPPARVGSVRWKTALNKCLA